MKRWMFFAWIVVSGVTLCWGSPALVVFHLPVYYAVADTDSVARQIAVVTGDALRGWEEGGETIQLFTGNVQGTQDSTILAANWAKRFVARKQVLFAGDVLIVDKVDSLFADTVSYDEARKMGQATGRVRLSDGEMIVYAPSGDYFIDEKRADFQEGFRLVDSSAVLTGLAGTYWTEEKRAELENDVRLQTEDTYLQADSLTYHREEETSLARGSVFIHRMGVEDGEADSTRRTVLFSEWAYHNNLAGYSWVQGQPLLIQLRQDLAGVDTLIVRARELASTEDEAHRLVATGDVRYWQDDLAALADSMVYLRADSVMVATDSMYSVEQIWLYGDPVLWVGDTQVSGDTIRIRVMEGEVDSMHVWGNAFVAQSDTVLERIHQLRGRMLMASFEEDSTHVFTIGPNAETIYFRRNEEGEKDGALRVSGDEAIFRFRGDDPEEVAFGGHEGVYYPEAVLPDPFELEGFRWWPERRPQGDVLLRHEHVLQWRACEANKDCTWVARE